MQTCLLKSWKSLKTTTAKVKLLHYYPIILTLNAIIAIIVAMSVTISHMEAVNPTTTERVHITISDDFPTSYAQRRRKRLMNFNRRLEQIDALLPPIPEELEDEDEEIVNINFPDYNLLYKPIASLSISQRRERRKLEKLPLHEFDMDIVN